jgi:hypothetical protein
MFEIINRTSRDHYPVETKRYYQDVDIAFDVNAALNATRPTAQPGMVPCFERQASPRKAPWETSATAASPSDSGGDSGDSNYYLQRRVQGPMPFEKHSPHQQQTFHYVPAVYDVEYTSVEHSPRSAKIHASAPGHKDLHTESMTEIGPAPSLALVRGNTVQNVDMAKQPARREPPSTIHDLEYPNVKNPFERRVIGDPMIASSLTRAKREKVLSSGQQGTTDLVYTYQLPSTSGTAGGVADFAKQVHREDMFAGHLSTSWSYQKNHPKAPGPGTYDAPLKWAGTTTQ